MSEPTSGPPAGGADPSVPGSTQGAPAGAPSAAGGLPPASGRKRPGGLTFLLVMALILGGLGGIISLKNTVPMLKGKEAMLAEATSGLDFAARLNPAMNDDMLAAQRGMVEATLEATMEYRGVTVVLGLANLLLCIGLVLGAIRCFQYKEKGRGLLAGVMAAHLPYQLFAMVITWTVAEASLEVAQEWMPRMMAASGASATAGASEFATNIGSAIAKGTAVVMALALGSYYLWSFLYLRKDRIKQIFE